MVKAKTYLAAPWIDRTLMDERASHFESLGYTITHKWWHYEGVNEEAETDAFLREQAVKDFNGVVTADVVVVFNTAKSEGKAVEQGIALASKVPIILIEAGNASLNIFHRLPQYHKVKSLEEALKELENVTGN